MNSTFDFNERLFRAVYPPSVNEMFWKQNGMLSSAAFKDKRGLSVERGYHRKTREVIEDMKKHFSGCIVSVSVQECLDVEAVVRHLPSERSQYHSEIHGSQDKKLLSNSQSYYLTRHARLEYQVK